MPGRAVKPEEVVAGDIVASRLGGEAKPRDIPGAPDATYDFDICLPDGRNIALEVTSAADPELLSMRAAQGRVWKAPSLSADWWISFAGGSPVNIKSMLKGLEAHLKVLEEHGVTEVSKYSPASGRRSSAVTEATSQILAGRITAARSWNRPAPGTPARMLLTPHRGFISDAEQVNPLVARAAEDNAKKLRAADADERHLFVWIDEDKAELAMFTQGPPPTVPDLPAGIDGGCPVLPWNLAAVRG